MPSALLPGHVAQLTQGHREVCLCSEAHNNEAGRFGGTLGEDQGCFTSQCSQGLGIFPPGLSYLEKSRQRSKIGLKWTKGGRVVASNCCSENPEHCGCAEPSTVKEETKRKGTSREMEAQRRLELVSSWSWLVLLFLSHHCGGVEPLSFSTDSNMVTIIAPVYAAQQKKKKKRSFRASQTGGN